MQQAIVLPSDTLLVSFDMTHGKDNEICIVAKKDGKMITIVNAFEGQDAEDVFKLLTTVDHKKKPWSEDRDRYRCPYCNSEFDDDLPYACRTPDFHMPKYCPDCGKPILMKQEEQGQEHQV